jgi:hypothetical protein
MIFEILTIQLLLLHSVCHSEWLLGSLQGQIPCQQAALFAHQWSKTLNTVNTASIMTVNHITTQYEISNAGSLVQIGVKEAFN